MKIIKEFKEFAFKGNVVDLAIAVIVGAAFSKIISSLIDDIITPLLLKPALDAANIKNIEGLVIWDSVKYGSFLAAVINFLLIAFILFLLIKGMNASKRKKNDAEILLPSSKEATLLTEIRDILKAK
jgi:large conductance mechanosensitive channel